MVDDASTTLERWDTSPSCLLSYNSVGGGILILFYFCKINL